MDARGRKRNEITKKAVLLLLGKVTEPCFFFLTHKISVFGN